MKDRVLPEPILTPQERESAIHVCEYVSLTATVYLNEKGYTVIEFILPDIHGDVPQSLPCNDPTCYGEAVMNREAEIITLRDLGVAIKICNRVRFVCGDCAGQTQIGEVGAEQNKLYGDINREVPRALLATETNLRRHSPAHVARSLNSYEILEEDPARIGELLRNPGKHAAHN